MIILGSLLIGLTIGFLLGLLIFPNPPLWAFIPGSLVAAVILIPGLAKILVFRVGIGNKKVVFRKLLRNVEIEIDEVVSINVFTPFDSSDLTKPLYKVKGRRVTFELHGGRSMVFSTIEPRIVNELLRVFRKRKNTSKEV